MTKKQVYQIFCATQEESTGLTYKYKFRGTEILFKIKTNAFYFRMEMKSDKDVNNFLESDYFKDFIVKIYILHFILFSKELKITKLIIKVNEQEKKYNFEELPLLYSLVENSLENNNIPEKWNDERFIKKFLDTPKTNYDSRFSALFAFIIAKSKKYEIERFENLWIAINGLYNFFSNKTAKERLFGNTDKKYRISEKDQIYLFGICNGWENCSISQAENDKIGKELLIAFNEINEEISFSKVNFENGIWKEKINKILSAEKKDNIDCYAFLLLHFAYYLRCQFFHANKPLPLITINGNPECKVLKLVNTLLEEYLSEKLYLFFIDDFLNKTTDLIEKNRNVLEKVFKERDGKKSEKNKKTSKKSSKSKMESTK